jgi:hypothetical protein
MNRRQSTALGIADALLAGVPEAALAIERCQSALSSRARWIKPLVHEMLARFAPNWRDAVRHDMAAAVCDSAAFAKAWTSAKPPRLRSYSLTRPRMAPLPPALSDCVVPELPTSRDVARWLRLDLDALAWLTGPLERPLSERTIARHYSYRWLAKRSGGARLLEVPKPYLRAAQRHILRRLLAYVPPHEAAHGFRQRRSCVTNAQAHVGKAVVLKMDLTDFFGSIGGGKVYALFSALGYPVAVARVLTRLTTTATPRAVLAEAGARGDEGAPPLLDWYARKRFASPHLPQGAPTSPLLANLCAFDFDLRVQALAEKFDLQYTRYADDLTFSGGVALARRVRAFEAHVAAIALEEGFRVNHRKTRVQRASARQLVTGVVVNRRPNVAREHYERLKAILHNCARHGPHTQRVGEVALLEREIAGHIAHIAAIHPARGARLRGLYERVRWIETDVERREMPGASL